MANKHRENVRSHYMKGSWPESEIWAKRILRLTLALTLVPLLFFMHLYPLIMKRALFCLTLFLYCIGSLSAQSLAAKQEAHTLSTEGHEFMSEQRYKDAIIRFSRAHRLDASQIHYSLNLADAYFYNKQFEEALNIVKPILKSKKATAKVFQLYGNCQDQMGNSYEALQTYRDGLKDFPNSGVLYMEMGILEFGRNRDAEALLYWEGGIRANPTFPSNYYFAAKTMLSSGDYAWAAIYAEMFLNLERIGDRVREISKVLMHAYEKARIYDFEKAFKWSFSEKRDSQAIQTDFHLAMNTAFESEMMDTTYKMSIAGLVDIRRFVCFYMNEQYPNNPAIGLFSWQSMIASRGINEGYTYWLLYDARPEEFLKWYETRKTTYDEFESWYLRNTYHKHFREVVARPFEE